jgi:hypothetical protein
VTADRAVHVDPASTLRFRDPAHQAAFERDGFVRTPFIDQAGIASLQRLWSEVSPPSVRGIYSNVHDHDLATNRHVDRCITEIFAGPAERVFANAHLGGASFLVKGPGSDSASTLHQDWNNVDETTYISASIWCPLVDVDGHNGALVVLPGSHRSRRSIRSLDTDSLYLEFTPELEPRLAEVPARAGEAVIYAHNLFHGSKPNWSPSTRVAAVSGVLPRGSRTLHHRRAADRVDDTFDVLEVERDFYFGGLGAMKQGELPPTARVVGAIHVPEHQLRPDDLFPTGEQQ